MTCCSNCAQETTGKYFSRWSKKYERQFRRKGLEKMQRLLLEGVRKETVTSKEVLDIGCGVGALHLTLLQEGAAKSTGIDMAEGMLEGAKKIAESLGLTEKVSYLVGDFVQSADSIPAADITLLDKVVCCYEDVETLVEKSTAKTRVVYAVTHPRENLLAKFSMKTTIFFHKLFRAEFHPYWHDWARVRDLIVARGFELIYQNATPLWQIVVYKRV